jgi:1,2-diacylglycerol 3-beta-galactosyltransferase
MSGWLRCADVVIAKAGPGTIAEATCCGAPLLLTSHLPGQEKGNARFVTAARAGRHAPRRRQMLRERRIGGCSDLQLPDQPVGRKPAVLAEMFGG